jgi:hypothetical protein
MPLAEERLPRFEENIMPLVLSLAILLGLGLLTLAVMVAFVIACEHV